MDTGQSWSRGGSSTTEIRKDDFQSDASKALPAEDLFARDFSLLCDIYVLVEQQNHTVN